jgi:hypothetical protein
MTIAYTSSGTAITISLASLATSSTFVAGRESNEIDWTAILKDDALLEGKIRVGTTPTANTQINIYLWGRYVSLATAPLDVLDGVDSAETITSAGVLVSFLAPPIVLQVDSTTTDRDYCLPATSVAQRFGGIMPPFWGIYVAHNTGANLNSTGGNHALTYTAVNWS